MFSVLQCDRLEPLAEHLFEEMARDPLPPLTPEVVVIAQNRGLRGWLRNALAEASGCAASLDTPSPRALCLRLARALVPLGAAGNEARVPRDPFDPDPLAWRVAAFLEEVPGEARYAPLRAYLAGGADRTLPLARRIAERFSDYQVYRPRLLEKWTGGENPYPDHPHAAWQAPLWRRLVEGTDRPDRARQLLALCEKLRSERIDAGRLPKRVSVFGAGLFPPLYLDVLAALARHVPVRFYLAGAAGGRASGTEDADEEHTVFARRLGRQRRAFCDLLDERAGDAWDALASDEETPEGALGALGVLKAGRRQGGAPSSLPFSLKAGDRSLSIHSCHSRRRELEVLRDQLLDAFDAMPSLKPSDVLVAVPGLDAYAPLIETTFEAEEAGDARLPVHIASAKHGQERRVLQAAAALLALPERRCTAPEVMELLDYPVLRRAAGLAPDEVPVARRWVREAGVRWGRSAEHRATFDAPATGAGTWRAGLDRLLLGHVTGPTGTAVCGHPPPCAEANADRAELLGRLAAWLHRLFSFADDAQRPRPLAAWSARLGDLFTDLLAPESDAEHDAAQHLAETAQGLEHLAALAPGAHDEHPQRAPFTTVREHCEEAIRAYEARAEHVTGSVTFAEPMALRFAPYRVVAFLGLGDAFPPTPARPADDLIAASALRPGDHDAEREGAQLFCDALHAAEDRLILTLVGRSEKDNAERAPSAVLEALLETCENTFTVEGESAGEDPVRERLVTEHPLQPFHPDYFTPGGALFSYDRAHGVARSEQPSVPPFAGAPLPSEGHDTGATIRLSALQRAWAHPAKFFCTRVLGLRLDGEAALDAQQPISPGALAAYHARQEALEMALHGGEGNDAPAEQGAARLEADGALPPGRQGRAWFARRRAEARQVARAVEARGERRPRTLRAEGDGWAVAGRLDHVAEGGALAFRCAEPKAKDFIRAWPAHLLLCAAGTETDPRETHVIGSGGAAWRFRPLAVGHARKLLYRLVRGYRAIRRAPRPFFPASSLACADAGSDYYEKKDARKAFYDGYRPGEESDPYVALCFRGRDPLGEDFDLFKKWAKAFWDPVLQFRAKA